MDVAQLSAFLAPFLPFLVTAGQSFASKAGGELGTAAWEHAKKLWSRLKPNVEEKEAAKEAADGVAADPEDQSALGALQFQLRKIMDEDPALEQEIGRLWEEAKAANVVISVGQRGVGIAGNVTGSVISTGDGFSMPQPPKE